MKRPYKLFFIVLLLIFISKIVHAAEVITVKGTKAILKLEENEVPVGQEYFAVDTSGKKRAILKVTQSKNGKALVEIVKGKVEVGYSTTPKEQSAISKPTDSEAPTFTRAYSGNSWGVLGSTTQTTMSVTIPTSSTHSTPTTVAMKGSNFGVTGFYDYGFNAPGWIIRGIGGYEQFTSAGTSATSSCNNSSDCTFNVSYLSMYGVLRYNFLTGKWKTWAGLNYGFLFAMSKSSNIIDTGGISLNQLYGFNFGVDIPLTRKNYIPVTIEFGQFPSSSSVTSSFFTMRAGYAWNF